MYFFNTSWKNLTFINYCLYKCGLVVARFGQRVLRISSRIHNYTWWMIIIIVHVQGHIKNKHASQTRKNNMYYFYYAYNWVCVSHLWPPLQMTRKIQLGKKIHKTGSAQAARRFPCKYYIIPIFRSTVHIFFSFFFF